MRVFVCLGSLCGAPKVWCLVYVVCGCMCQRSTFVVPNIESLGGLGSVTKALVTHWLGTISLRCILVPFESINVSFAPSCSLVDGLCALLYLIWFVDWLLLWQFGPWSPYTVDLFPYTLVHDKSWSRSLMIMSLSHETHTHGVIFLKLNEILAHKSITLLK